MFDSFFLAGFECATGYNRHGNWIDQIVATQHDRFVLEDYQMVREVGIRAVRDSIRWPLVDRGSEYDFSSIDPFLHAARECGITVIWDLFHYGYPRGVDLFSDTFPPRFAAYCRAAAQYVMEHSEGPWYFTPVNEPSYFAWAAGHAAVFAPHATGRAPELKRNLIRAAIQGINAIRSVCPEARIVNVDPICRVVPPVSRPDLQAEADHFNHSVVFESWDMLAGRLHPELGGSPEHLDIAGINYYWTNQWDLTRVGTPLAEEDPRKAPLRDLIRSVWERYQCDVLITETSHRDEHRPGWMRQLAVECEALLDDGVSLGGACLYPILGMPEWHAPEEWTRMGLWDLVPQSPTLGRVPCKPMLQALREAQRLEKRRAALRGTEMPLALTRK